MPKPGWVLITLLLVAPAALSLLSPLQVGRDFWWIVGALAGIVALSLVVLQVLLTTPWLIGILDTSTMRLHRLLGLAVAGVVIAHVLGLYLYSPDDVSDALVLAAPTHSRLGVLSAWCVLLSVALALARRRLGLTYSDWQILHAALAVFVVATAVGHTLMIRGTLDGPLEIALCLAAVAAVSGAVWFRYVMRPSRST